MAGDNGVVVGSMRPVELTGSPISESNRDMGTGKDTWSELTTQPLDPVCRCGTPTARAWLGHLTGPRSSVENGVMRYRGSPVPATN